MGWRGSETGKDSKATRKKKVQKWRKERWGPDLERGEGGEQRRDTEDRAREEQTSPSPSVGRDRREGVTP